MRLGTSILFAALLTGCAAGQSSREDLHPALTTYHNLLRWKQFDGAARFRHQDDQSAFLARYLRAEDDLSIESLEVRSVHWNPIGGIPGADVTVVGQAYLLPSTVLQKVVIQERWEVVNDRWVLMHSDKELLADPVLDSPAPLKQEASGGIETEG